MEFCVLRAADELFVPQAVKLHYDALSYRSTITAFGLGFLGALYEGMLADGLGFVVVAHERERLCGFILACTDAHRMMSTVARRPLRFLRLMLPALARRPSLALKLSQTLFYARKEGVHVDAELVVIAVDASQRSRGIGRQLLHVLDGELGAHGITRYKVTVHDAMADSNRFYVQNGMHLRSTFRMYGVPWTVYVRELAEVTEGR
jgi:ribosomal protein S18 acetylase RimI-like enzyme